MTPDDKLQAAAKAFTALERNREAHMQAVIMWVDCLIETYERGDASDVYEGLIQLRNTLADREP
jgi:hypothetical protein